MAKPGATRPRVYELKVTLQGVDPPIWRRFLVLDDTTLAKFHDCLQALMGWTNSHLHHFMAAGMYYGPLDAEFPRRLDERTVRIASLLRDPGDRLTYEYDFGDGWEHEIVVERILAPEPGGSYPVVVAGDRACPPENSGGISGYERLLEVMRDTRDPEYRDMRRWVGKGFDPEAFDIEAVNRALQRTVDARASRSRPK